MKALHKPSVVAAELNRIARAEPEAVAELIAAALALRAVQDEVMSGRPADLAEPRRDYRAAVARVAGSALRHQVRVQGAVQAAAADPTQHAKLRDGTFAAEPKLPVGFEGVPSHVEQRGGQPTKEAATSRTTGKAAATRRQLTSAVRSAEKALDAAGSRRRAAKEALAAAAAAAAQLDEQAASLEEQLAEIQRAQANAQTSVAAAQSDLDQATEAHEAANRELSSARQLLNDADSAAG